MSHQVANHSARVVHKRLFSALGLVLLCAGTAIGAVSRGGHLIPAPDLAASGTGAATLADTVVVFGPRRLEAGRGVPALHVERFEATAGQRGGYLLRLQADALGNATRVLLNGVPVATAQSLRQGGGTLEVPVALLPQNVLAVTVDGAQGTAVTATVLLVPEPSFVLAGPRTVERRASAPVTVVERFALPPGAAPPYRLHVRNGDEDGSRRTTSGVIRVNGAQVVGPGDLSPLVGALVRTLSLGAQNTVEVELRGAPGTRITFHVTAMDTAAPSIQLTAPAAGMVTRAAEVEVTGAVQDATPTTVTVNGVQAARTGTVFRATVPLSGEGTQQLTVSATDAAGNRTDSVRTVIRDTQAPVITLEAPGENEPVRDSVVTVRGTIRDRTAVQANVNGIPLAVDSAGRFQAVVPVGPGVGVLTVTATDAAGNAASATRQVVRDTEPPVVAVLAPADGLVTNATSVVVEGVAQDASPVRVRVAGMDAVVGDGGAFRVEVPLAQEGPATLEIVATDGAGNETRLTRGVVRDTQVPAVTVDVPEANAVTRDAQVEVRGRIADASAVTLTLAGTPVVVGTDGAFAAAAPLAEGENVLELAATDAAGNRATASVRVTRDSEAPALTLATPSEGTVTSAAVLVVEGRATDRTALTVTVNGAATSVDADGAFRAELPLSAQGRMEVEVIATDAAGNTSSLRRAVVRDSDVPALDVLSPAEGTVTREASVRVQGTVADSTALTLTIDGTPVAVGADGAFAADAPLAAQGENRLEVAAVDAAGNRAVLHRSVVRDGEAPVLEIAAPAPGAVTRDPSATVTGTVRDATAVQVTVNGAAAAVTGEAFTATLTLAEGANAIAVRATDAAGNVTEASTSALLDTQPPALLEITPADGALVRDEAAVVTGRVTDASTVAVRVNGQPVALDAAGGFAAPVVLAEGENPVAIELRDAAGNETASILRIVRDSRAPVITVSAPTDGTVTEADRVEVAGRVEDATPVAVTVNGTPVTLGADGSFRLDLPLSVGVNVITVQATDALGNAAAATRTVTRAEPGGDDGLPPDPSRVAPPLDRSVPVALPEATEFLYSGPNPIQTGVAPGTLQPARLAVLRGRVLTREGAPLPGVTVTVRDHPEFGETLSRADGMFDLAVNGGGRLTVEYRKGGYLPVQRPVSTPWQDYVWVEDAALVGLDSGATVVTFGGAEPQVARGSVVADEDGPRRATVVFEPGTTAELEHPDGTRTPASSLTIRATEYTVGEGGPRAMPGPLPSTVAYTYAVELSADEAVAAGAEHVRFDRPVGLYVDNFLGFPVGTPVPVAWYDRDRAVWVPEEDGRVLGIVGVAGGEAQLDADGDGVAETPQALDGMGITAAERQALAATHQAGQSVWRAQTRHFSSVDLNFPSDPNPPPDGPGPGPEGPEDDNRVCEVPGSIIECQTRTLGERIGVAGTPFTLNYRSRRVPGRTSDFRLDIPLLQDSVPADLVEVQLEVFVAGRRFQQSFVPAPNLSYVFEWDGKDAYGRTLPGGQQVSVRIGYASLARFLFPQGHQYREEARSFGLTCTESTRPGWDECIIPADANVRGTYSGARGIRTAWRWWSVAAGETRLGTWDTRGQGLGGWTLDAHHVYDAASRTLHLGSGRHHTAAGTQLRALRVVAGNGEEDLAGFGGPATEAALARPTATAFAADGTLYLAGETWIGRVLPDGVVARIAGGAQGCSAGPCGDGGPAADAGFAEVRDLSLAADGSLYVADVGQRRVRVIGADGVIRAFAGGGEPEEGDGDGGPAADARLRIPVGVAAAPDGTVYIAETNAQPTIFSDRVRRVGPDGTIATVAGGGSAPERYSWTGEPCYQSGIPAAQSCLREVAGVRVNSEGMLYVLERERLLRMDGAGGLVRVAGDPDGACIIGHDGGSALETGLCASRMALGPDGSVYLDDTGLLGSRIRRIHPDGTITSVVGNEADYVITRLPGGALDPQARTADAGARQAAPPAARTLASSSTPSAGGERVAGKVELYCACALAVHPDGSLYVANQFTHVVMRVGPPLPGYQEGERTVVSEDGGELYAFDGRGRHLRTRDARTGALRYTFSSGARGQLASVTDGDGLVTRIEHAADGRPTSIVGPYGQRTALEVDGAGWLSRVTNAADEATAFTYTPDGLLTSMTDPRGGVSRCTWDKGLLVRDEDPAGGFQAITETRIRNCTTAGGVAWCQRGRGVEITDATGRSRSYFTASTGVAQGGKSREVTDAAGRTTQSEERNDGVRVVRHANGMQVSRTDGADPRFGTQVPMLARQTIETPGGVGMEVEAGRRVELADPANPLSIVSVTDSAVVNGRMHRTVYDAAARTYTTVSPTGRTTEVLLDSVGRVIERRAPGVLPVRYAYDGDGRLETITHGPRTWRYGYTARGYLATVMDPLARVTRFEHDSVGRVLRSILPGGREIGYTYDRNGNPTSVTPAGRAAHVFAYDSANRVRGYTAPTVAGGGGDTRTVLDLSGRATSIFTPDGEETRFGYDEGGRLEQVTLPDAVLRYGYSGTGMLESFVADGDTLAFGFDGALPTSVQSSGSVNGYVEQGYDSDLRVAYQWVNFGSEVWYGYDDDGLLTQAGDLAVTRDTDSGRMTETVLGGVSTGYAYDEMGELAGLWAVQDGDTLFRTVYRRDAGGRIDRITETSGASTVTWTYDYDSAGRLTTVQRDGQPFAAYEYDANGNRLTAVSAGGVATAAYDGQDRMLSLGGAQYGYTEVGLLRFRVVGSDTTHYGYDARGILREVRLPDGTRIEYLADAAGRRTGQVVNGVRTGRYLYGRTQSPVAEVDSAGDVVTRFVHGVAGHVPDYMVRGDRTFRLVIDHLGSVRRVVDTATGEVVQEIDYDAFGRVLRDSNPGFQPFGYAGGLVDAHTGFVRFGARDYDPQAGRWTAKDPSGFGGGTANLYEYASNNPTNLVDPNGQIAFIPILMAAWGIAEIGMSVADFISFLETLADACATTVDKLWSGGFFFMGLAGPGGTGGKGDDFLRQLDELTDDALVCRGGTCTAEQFEKGSGVVRRPDGTLDNVSVSSAPGKSVKELSAGYPNGQVGVTTVGEIRAMGGTIIQTPSGKNPYHCDVCGLTGDQLNSLFTPTIRNPNRP